MRIGKPYLDRLADLNCDKTNVIAFHSESSFWENLPKHAETTIEI